jgi:DNA-binding XRE family transcriptional regulator
VPDDSEVPRTSPDLRPPDSVILGENIYKLRQRMDPPWSQEKLAREADLSRQAVVSAENNRDTDRSSNATRLDTLVSIANALGVTAADLLTWDAGAKQV